MAGQPIVHIEIASNDPAASDKFYAEVFGWKIEVDPRFNYHQFQAEGGPGGAFLQVGDSEMGSVKPGEVLVYIASEDVAADLAKIEANGGTVLVPQTEIPQTGWFGVFTDPAGAKMALYKSMHPQS